MQVRSEADQPEHEQVEVHPPAGQDALERFVQRREEGPADAGERPVLRGVLHRRQRGERADPHGGESDSGAPREHAADAVVRAEQR